MPGQPVLINGVSYGWAQVSILIGTNVFFGITKLSFEKSTKKDNNMGVGDEPIARGYGEKGYKASISIYMEDVKKIIAASPEGSLDSVPMFTIKAIYGHPSNPTVDILYNCEFTTDGNDMSQGDTKFVKDYPLIYAGQRR